MGFDALGLSKQPAQTAGGLVALGLVVVLRLDAHCLCLEWVEELAAQVELERTLGRGSCNIRMAM